MTDIDLKEMREIAKKATPSEWDAALHNGTSGFDIYPEHGREVGVRICRVGRNVDAKYITSAQPRNILALLDRLEAAEAERDAARALLKRAGEALEPFAEFGANNTDEFGWINSSCKNDRVCDWLGPSELQAARAIHAEIKEAIDD